MREIELKPSRTKFLVSVYDDGKLSDVDRFDPDAGRPRRTLARKIGVDDVQFLDWIAEARKAGEEGKRFTVTAEAAHEAKVVIRPGRESDPVATHPLDSRFVKETLASIPTTLLIQWDDIKALCCLDIDYHEGYKPPADWLETMVFTKVSPRPIAWHLSKSGHGLHLFYVATGKYDADELAAVAALRFRAIDPTAGLELKHAVWGPGDRPVHTTPTQDTGSGLVAWLGESEYDEDEKEEWLADRGMECGKRYDHDKCPIDPTPDDGKHRQPVCVYDEGIYCFKCEGQGAAIGRRKPGWVSWAALLGSRSAGDLGAMVRNIVHWGHARWVLTQKYDMPEPLARRAYAAALKAYHAERPTETLATDPGLWDENNERLARVNDLWFCLDDSYPYPKDIGPLLSTLPACKVVDAEGAAKVNPATVCELNQPKSIAHRGYASIEVVHGFRMTKPWLEKATDPVRVAVATRNQPAPRYFPKSKRMPLDEAWGVIDSIFPRLDRKLVSAAMCSFACAQETRSGMLPIVFVSGPSGAAKTSTIRIAAGIYGAMTHDVVFEPEPAKFRQNIWTGATTCPVVLCNEILKDSSRGRYKLSPKDALDPLLNITEHSATWVSYRGPVKMGRLPAIYLTEPVCPLTLRDETQIARRVRHYRVHGRKDEWKRTVAASGLTDFHYLRGLGKTVNAACDSILSDCCDTWFAVPATWDSIADAHDVHTIEDSPDFDDLSPYLLEFFKLVCAAPDLSGKLAVHKGPGYKRISRADASPADTDTDTLLSVYSMFADGGGADWVSSRRLQEKDWSSVLKTEDNVWLDMQNDGVNVFVRFRSGPPKAPGTKFNGDIVP